MDLKKFGDNIKSSTGVSVAALFIILATNGKEFIEALTAFPTLVQAFSQGLPFGFWSGATATILAASFHMFARSWHTRSLGIEIATIMVGMATVMVQQQGGEAGEVLSALFVGLVAGFGGLFIAKIIRSLYTKEKDCDETESN